MIRITESARVTPGLMKAIGKMPSRGPCASCGFPMPSYPGRYPKTCPGCGEQLPESQAPKRRDGTRRTT